jgi:hypothetical protein
MCRVIDLSPSDSFIGGGEDAAYAADFSIGKQRRIGRPRRGHAEADDIGLRHVCQLSKAGAAIGRVPQTINVAGIGTSAS